MRLAPAIAAVSLVVAAAAGASVAVAADPVTPRVLGWERYFTLDWQGATSGDRPVVEGHIRNEWGYSAMRIRLLVDRLDAAGQVVAQQVEWFPGTLEPGTQAYFRVPVAAAAPAYRVSVYAFDWVQAGGGDNR